MRFNPHPYQLRGIRALIDNSAFGLLFDPGLGKTATFLSAYKALKIVGFHGALVVAPPRVTQVTWPDELARWDQFKDLSWVRVAGTKKRQIKMMESDADIKLITPGLIPWLAQWMDEGGKPKCNFLTIDESTKFKNPTAKCTKALLKIAPTFKRRVVMTGTPSPQGLEDLWSQIHVLDGGARLEKKISHYRAKYSYRGGYNGYEWIPLETSQRIVEEKIADIVLRLDAKDYLTMPELIETEVPIILTPELKDTYKQIEKKFLLDLLNGDELVASNTSQKYAWLKQFCSGAVYTEPGGEDTGREWTEYHQLKINALEELVDELHGKPVMVCYHYRHELQRLKAWRDAPHIGSGVTAMQVHHTVANWNEAKYPIIYVNSASMAHGLNMQNSGNDIIWFTLTDNLENYIQTNRRIYRQGVRNHVRVRKIVVRDTVDVVLNRLLQNKNDRQKTLLDHLRDYAHGNT